MRWWHSVCRAQSSAKEPKTALILGGGDRLPRSPPHPTSIAFMRARGLTDVLTNDERFRSARRDSARCFDGVTNESVPPSARRSKTPGMNLAAIDRQRLAQHARHARTEGRHQTVAGQLRYPTVRPPPPFFSLDRAPSNIPEQAGVLSTLLAVGSVETRFRTTANTSRIISYQPGRAAALVLVRQGASVSSSFC